MLTWAGLRDARPDLADAGRELLYQFGVGLGFLGTVRGDGGPRVHPMCPVITDAGLYALIVPSPKLGDLRRDGQYVMHSFPCPNNEDAFYITGHAEARADPELRARIDGVFLDERRMETGPPGFHDQSLFEFLIDGCMLTRTTGHGDPEPRHTIWKTEG